MRQGDLMTLRAHLDAERYVRVAHPDIIRMILGSAYRKPSLAIACGLTTLKSRAREPTVCSFFELLFWVKLRRKISTAH